MSATRHFKLGVFALAALGGAAAIALVLGVRGVGRATVEYHTYFDESVQGLEVGSPVKYRGVRIGDVAATEIAPDRQHVDVALSLARPDADRLGLDHAAPSLRAQLGTQGITGVKYVDVDVATPGSPAPALPFEPDARYIPARASLLKGLSDRMELLGDRLPGLADRADAARGAVERTLDELHDAGVATRLATLLDDADRTVTDGRRVIAGIDRARLGDRAGAALDDARATMTTARGAIDRVAGSGGLVAHAERAIDSVGSLASGAIGGAGQLEHVLRDLDETSGAIRDFFDELDREPDILVKGRSEVAAP